jgi:excisionase family DNA binding protein
MTADKASRRRQADRLRDVADELDPPEVEPLPPLPGDVEATVRDFARSHIGKRVAKAAENIPRIPAVRRRPKRLPEEKRDARLLSAREAARRLGVSRGKTIAALIDSGRLRTVTVNGRVRIPASEVERLAREGFDTTRD